MIYGQIDSTFTTTQCDLVSSGTVAEIGVVAFTVWSVIKYSADFQTGESFRGLRGIGDKIGMSKDSVNRAVEVLKKANLLRIVEDSKFKRKGQTYIARERLQIRMGHQVICTVVIDYIPSTLRTKIIQLKKSLETGNDDPNLWAQIEIIPGPGFIWDEKSKSLKMHVLPSQIQQDDLNEEEKSSKEIAKEALAKMISTLSNGPLLKNAAPSQNNQIGTSLSRDGNSSQ